MPFQKLVGIEYKNNKLSRENNDKQSNAHLQIYPTTEKIVADNKNPASLRSGIVLLKRTDFTSSAFRRLPAWPERGFLLSFR